MTPTWHTLARAAHVLLRRGTAPPLLGVAALCALAACSSSIMADADADADVRDLGGPVDLGVWIELGGPDMNAPEDLGVPDSCAADDAREAPCPRALCDGPDSWHWNGDSCFSISCGACEGRDCDRRVVTREACEAAHAACTPQRCRDTGGRWLWWAEECEHYLCGRPQPAACLVGRPVCDCGPSGTFDPDRGCVADARCAIEPVPPTDEAACTTSGGLWEGICCHTDCGEFCPLPCAQMACNCGPGRVFTEGLGCVEAARCYERGAGDTCDARSRCAGGTLCCRTCGGAGCVEPATCRPAVCDSDPRTDLCGNRVDAP